MTTLDELQRAVERLEKALKIADQYATGMHFGEGNDGFSSFADLRALLSERSELLATVERMRGGLKKIASCHAPGHYIEGLARAALATGEEE